MEAKRIIKIIITLSIVSQIISTLYLPFKTYKTTNFKGLTNSQIAERIITQIIYTPVKIGTPEKEINLNIEMNTPYLSVISKKFGTDSSNIPFDKTSSSSYHYLNETEQIHLDRYVDKDGKDGKYDCDISGENFKFAGKKAEGLRFFLVTENYVETQYTINSGVMGLDLNRKTNHNAQYYRFIRRLKEVDAIDNYDFCFEFNSKDSDEGTLILGGNHNDTDGELNRYEVGTVYADYSAFAAGLRWGITFDEANFTTIDEDIQYTNQYALQFTFSPSNNSILLPKNLHDSCIEDLLSNYVSSGLCSKDLIFNESYFIYNCINDKKKVNFKKFPKITFHSKDFNETYEFSFDEVSQTVGDRVYWLVIFRSTSTTIEDRDVLGKPFFKKYGKRIFFNYDKNLVGYFTTSLTEEERKKIVKIKTKGVNAFTIILIILLSGLVCGMGFFIYKKRKLLNIRRKRASEMEDEYTYLPELK